MGWMTNLTPLVVSSMGPPVIGCTLFFLTGTSPDPRLPRRRRPRPRLSAPPLPWPAGRLRLGPPRSRRCSVRPVAPQAAARAAATMACRPAALRAAVAAALLCSAVRTSGRRPRRRSHGRPAAPQAAAATSPSSPGCRVTLPLPHSAAAIPVVDARGIGVPPSSTPPRALRSSRVRAVPRCCRPNRPTAGSLKLHPLLGCA